MIQQLHFLVFDENANTNLKRFLHPSVHCSIIYSSPEVETVSKCPSIDEWIKKMWHKYTTEYYFATKKE